MCRRPLCPLRHRNQLSAFLVSALLMATFLVSRPTHAVAEGWTDLNATRTIEARLVGLWGDSVVLQMQDGRKVTVRLNDLNAESRIQAQKLGRAKIASRKTRVEELQGQAAEAAAPAPNPLPTPPAAPTYVPPTPGAACVAQLQWYVDQSQAGHLRAQFDVLPMAYRGDLDKLVKQAVGKIDPAGFQSLIGGLHQVGELIVTRQRWLFSHPRLQALQPSTQDTIHDVLLNAGGLLRVGLDPQAVDPAKLQSMPLDQWIAERSDAMAPYLAALSNIPGATANKPAFELVSEKDGVTNVKVMSGQSVSNQSYIEVDGFWVAKEMADNWTTKMEEANKNLSDVPPGSLLSGGMSAMVASMITPMLEPMMSAQNEKDFHASLEPLFAQIGPLLSQLPGMMGTRSRGGYDDMDMDMGYDDEMMDYEDEMMDMDQNMSQ